MRRLIKESVGVVNYEWVELLQQKIAELARLILAVLIKSFCENQCNRIKTIV